MGKTYTEFTDKEKEEIYKELLTTGITQKELAKKHNTGTTTVFTIIKEQREKKEKNEKAIKEQKGQGIKEEIQELLKTGGEPLFAEKPKEVAVGMIEYQTLYKINTEQTQEIDKLEKELKSTIEVLEKEAEKSIEKDKLIKALQEKIESKEVAVKVDTKNMDVFEEMRLTFMNLIFDVRVEKKVRQEYAFKMIEVAG